MSKDSNVSHALCTLAPLQRHSLSDRSYCDIIRERLANIPLNEASPFATVPDLYTIRFFVLEDVRYESLPGADSLFNFSEITPIVRDKSRLNALPKEDHLQSHYLVMICYFFGDLDTQLKGMWNQATDTVRSLWQYCYTFDSVTSDSGFCEFLKKCQVDFTLFFNGSTIDDDPNADSLAAQLKGLYLKQELARFAREHQHDTAEQLKTAYVEWEKTVQPDNLAEPRWAAGKSTVDD